METGDLFDALQRLAMALAIDWRSALAIILAGVVLLLGLRPLAKRIRTVSREMTGVQVQYAEELQDAATNSLDIRVFGATDVVSGRLTSVGHQLMKMRTKSGFLSGSLQPAYQYAGLLLVLLVAAAAVVTLAGHTGGVLAYGQDYLGW